MDVLELVVVVDYVDFDELWRVVVDEVEEVLVVVVVVVVVVAPFHNTVHDRSVDMLPPTTTASVAMDWSCRLPASPQHE